MSKKDVFLNSINKWSQNLFKDLFLLPMTSIMCIVLTNTVKKDQFGFVTEFKVKKFVYNLKVQDSKVLQLTGKGINGKKRKY